MRHERTKAKKSTAQDNDGTGESSAREQRGSETLFSLGRVVASPGALQALESAGLSAAHFLHLHQTGNWGEVDERDRKHNDRALTSGCRLLSAYTLPNTRTRIWVITEADRSVTTVLLPGEY